MSDTLVTEERTIEAMHTIVWHCENGDLGDGTVSSLNTTCTFIDRGQIGVHVTGVATTSGNFFTSGRYL